MFQRRLKYIPTDEDVYAYASLCLRGLSRAAAAESVWDQYSRRIRQRLAKAAHDTGMYVQAERDIRLSLRSSAKGKIMELREAAEILTRIGRAKVAHYLGPNNLIDPKKIRQHGGQEIAEYREVEDGEIVIRKLRLRDPVQAIERLSKMAGWDKPDVTKHIFESDLPSDKASVVGTVIDELWQADGERAALPPGQTVDVDAREVDDEGGQGPRRAMDDALEDDPEDSEEEEKEVKKRKVTKAKAPRKTASKPKPKVKVKAEPKTKPQPKAPGRPNRWAARRK